MLGALRASRPVKIALVYVFPNLAKKTYEPYAKRFSEQYVKHPPGDADHELYVVVNGIEISPRQKQLFSPLEPIFLYHNNVGRDVGAHRVACLQIPCDLIIFLGAPCWPGKTCWLDRIVRVFEDNGPALYGNYCFHQPQPHVRTTFYWAPPQLFNSHRLPIGDHLRYEWEHGSNSITKHCMKLGFPVLQVTWSHVCSIEKWHHVTEQECLMFDQHTERLSYGFGW